MNSKPYIACVPALLALGACATMEPPPLPESDVPQRFIGPVFDEAGVWPNTDWWNNFNDPELAAFIEEVKLNNLDLAINRRNLESAQIALREAGLARWPEPELTLSDATSYRRTSVDGATVARGNESSPTELEASFIYSGILTKPATYARDLADYDSQVAQAADVAMNTLGVATSTFFQLLLIRDRVVAARQNLENAEVIGRIAQARVDAGVSVPIDALQQQIQIERQRTALQSLIQSDLDARASLAVLVGRHVQGFDVAGQTLQNIEVPRVQPGLPSELLARRPDLYQAELALRSAAIDVSIARRQLFPQISLTATASSASYELANVLASPAETLAARIGGSRADAARQRPTAPRHRAGQALRREQPRELSPAVLVAFSEVEVALSNIQLLEEQAEVAASSLAAAEEAFRIAEVRYREGVADFETVLVAQNSLFSTRNAFLDNKLERLNAILSFYQMLGGGWMPGDIAEYWGVTAGGT